MKAYTKKLKSHSAVTYEGDEEGQPDVLLGDCAHGEESLQVLHKGPRVHGLRKVEVVVARHAVISHHTLDQALHVVIS